MISYPLLKWLSLIEDDSVSNQLQLLWEEILLCLRRCQPPIVFDSASLKLHAPLLEMTLDHPNSSISEPTIAFWNSTYGEQINLQFPQNLVNVLDKLSRNKRITLQKRNLPFLVKCQSTSEVLARHRYRATATNNSISKRVELVEDTLNQSEQTVKVCSSLKRKRIELTEHQKEVRRAQQGRERDCSGHGAGIKTYTNVDFSQGNGDSQESQEI
ncbi:uncharacterized protein LOC119997769 [Tripterygium wilfordii]|nr:uncharacterized protein LOC119997769 [Tripterygium wilfordii]